MWKRNGALTSRVHAASQFVWYVICCTIWVCKQVWRIAGGNDWQVYTRSRQPACSALSSNLRLPPAGNLLTDCVTVQHKNQREPATSH